MGNLRSRRWKLKRQLDPSPWMGLAFRVGALAAALLVAGIVIQLSGKSALNLGVRAIEGTIVTEFGRRATVSLTTPLVFTGLAVALALRMRLWNIGAEGQLFMGAWAATAVGLFVSGPTPLVLSLMVVAGALAGASWILVPALARAYAEVNEIVTTLLLNFVAVLIVSYFSIGPWRDKLFGVSLASRSVPYSLPTLASGALPVGALVAVGLAVGLALVLRGTRWGYEVDMVGGNWRAGRFAGMPVRRRILGVMLASGAMAGIGGAILLAGTAHRLSGSISNRYGYIGIIVAVLAAASPLAVVIVGFFLAVLLNAGIVLQTQGLSVDIVVAVNGLILLMAGIGEVMARFRLVRVSTQAMPPQAAAAVPPEGKSTPDRVLPAMGESLASIDARPTGTGRAGSNSPAEQQREGDV